MIMLTGVPCSKCGVLNATVKISGKAYCAPCIIATHAIKDKKEKPSD